MSKNIRIALLDDHPIVIDGLQLLLKTQPDFDIILSSGNGKELLDQLKHTTVDVLLTDIMMPEMNGYEVSAEVRKLFPAIKIIALSMNGEGDLADRLIGEINIDGYLLKTSDKTQLADAIRTVANGGTYYADEVMHEWKQFQKVVKQNEEINLTQRELEIISCIAKDMSNKQIADTLFISERTVETHRKNIFRKTETHSALALVEFAKKRKFIS